MPIPKYDDLFEPTIKALRELGGSAANQELEDKVAQILQLSEDQLVIMQPNHNRSQFSYRLAWARTHLKYAGLVDNTERGVWTLNKKGKNITQIDKNEISRTAKKASAEAKRKTGTTTGTISETEQTVWKEELLEVVRSMAPDAFERLCQRLLRESGFVNVNVTGRSGDGGIDGHGVVKLGGLLSFHVYFQAKRYKKSLTASIVRDFRGAMVGRADKGIIITTGVFTADAIKEAQRDGATPIDLLDADLLTEKLKQLHLGVDVRTRQVEDITVDKTWFEDI